MGMSRTHWKSRTGSENMMFRGLEMPNTGKQEKERRTCEDYLKFEESRVRIKCGSISKKKKSNYSRFQDLRSSCNEDMVMYEDPRPSTTRTRALKERSNKMIPPATTQPPGWRVCRSAEVCRPALGAHVFHIHSRRNLDKQEGSRPSKPTLDTLFGPGTDMKL
ncbi:hypothetical protein Tco_1020203 [Tanacetum coccineum]|uniref:Uncharacterized protein n=1 Tax=Tanacetum coccineum TaxID=301880 RepID=A0ABQ5G0T4_9ASTR